MQTPDTASQSHGSRRKAGRVAIALAALLGLAACATAPPYQPPAVDTPAAYKEAGASAAHPGGPAGIAPDWWRVYADARLDTLEQRIDVSSQTLRKAVALLQDARAQARAAHAAYFPTVGAGLSTGSSHTSANVVGRSLAGKTEPDHLLGLTASWEPDLWGRIGNGVDAAEARAQASADDVAAVRLGLQAELAADYFSLRSADRELDLLGRTVEAYGTVLALAGNRYRGGIATEGDVAQARAQLENTKAQLADLRLNRAQLEHAIATLVGEPAARFSLPPLADTSVLPALPAMPAALPSQLLERRPDIAAAERRVAAANAQIGVARAAFFPSLLLAVSGGVESTSLAGWLTAPSRFWAIGPALAATLFDGGRRQAVADSARAQFDASAADYRGIVLRAFQEVEDNFAALHALQQEAASQQAASEASERALALGLDRYRKGAVAYLDVSVLESAALASERAAEAVHRRQLVASVLLVKALGGGWEEPKDSRSADTAIGSEPWR
ncbi:efflux transporter outer membrane subunit [Cupriavidus basilensis]|uniref:Efflux transporter outer membrane subunit n=1 Tax=Cupriavidus basilensis TaxID=68895 RepID=A0ABT6B1F4_9BURK|nr:efflux transporter outer membrane subunit [Cupriavidus basilensis]MDF3838608.1 efflux transporter outer membrane subunit [Cupriavidus basilensis]